MLCYYVILAQWRECHSALPALFVNMTLVPNHMTQYVTSIFKMAAAKSKWMERPNRDNVLRFGHPLHANSLLQSLNETRKNPHLCDGVVVIGQTEIPVQKNVLAAASPYFRFVLVYCKKLILKI